MDFPFDFSLLELPFMQRALLAGLLGGAACGIVGVFVVLLRASFLGICIAHAAFAGSLLSILFGIPWQFGGMALGIGVSGCVWPLSKRGFLHPDATGGVLFSLMMTIALMVLGILPNAGAGAMELVWGSIVTVTRGDIVLLLAAFVLLLAFIFLFFKEIQAVICHIDIARACGIDVDRIAQGIFLLLGVVIVAGLKTIGGLLIYSLIVTPAVAASQLTFNLRRMLCLSAGFGVLSCWTGLFLSAYFDIPVGAAIVLVGILILLAVLGLKCRRSQ